MAHGTVKITSGPAAGAELAGDDELLIGRAADGEGTLAGDPELSRQHARISRLSGELTIEDLGSTNGTSVNGERISGPRQLRTGDVVSVGGSTIEVLGPPPPPVDEPAGPQHTAVRR